MWGSGSSEWRKTIGRDYSGFGLLWKALSLIGNQYYLNLNFLINWLVWSAIIILTFTALRISSKNLIIPLTTGLIFILVPSGPEQFLTILKLEKWSVLSVLLMVNALTHNRDSKLINLHIVGIIVGICVGTETLVFYMFEILFSILITQYRLHGRAVGSLSITYIKGIISFILFRLVPSVLNRNQSVYTSGFAYNTRNALDHFVIYIFREPSLLVLLIIALIVFSYSVSKDLSMAVNLQACLFYATIFDLFLLLFFWNQVQIYYLYEIQGMLILVSALYISKLKNCHARREFPIVLAIMVPVLTCLLATQSFVTFFTGLIQ